MKKSFLVLMALSMFGATVVQADSCLKPEYFSGASAFAFRYDSGQSIIGMGDSTVTECDDGALQAAAFKAAKKACGDTKAGKGFALLGWYRDGERVLGQQYDCGAL